MPLGAVITTRRIASAFQEMGVEYFNTFGGNPVCAAAGLAVLNVLDAEGLQEHALTVGNYMLARFRELQERLDLIGDIRGSGLFIGIELVRDRKTKEPATAETSFVCTTLKEKYDVLSSIDGLHDNVLVVKPPLVFSKADADYFVESFEKAAQDLRALGDDIRNVSKTPT
jgi:4-aminobutyrate aminotransferase-like enzyme